MGDTIPPQSKSQPASVHDDDPHESVTIAPPAPNFDELLQQTGPAFSLQTSSDQHFRLALDAGARAGSSLSDLAKLVTDLSSGLVGAKQANEQLVDELSTLRAMLGAANEQQLALKHRLALVEQELAASRQSAEHERQFLTAQQDEFLAALLDEHEEALRQHSQEAARVRDSAAQLQLQRDELRAEASQLRARLGTHRSPSTAPPPPVTNSRPPSFRPPAALKLDDGELDSTLHARSSSPRLPSVVPRFTPPPVELERALYTPRRSGLTPPSSGAIATAFPRESTRPGVGGPKPSEPPPPPSFGPPPSGWTPPPPAPMPSVSPRPAVVSAASSPSLPSIAPLLKAKPDPTTRPLIDYSLGKDSVLSETLEGARFSSKPPRK